MLDRKHELIVWIVLILGLIVQDVWMLATPTNVLHEKGLMGLYSFDLFIVPFLSIFIIVRLTNLLKEMGLRLWIVRTIRYGLIAYFFKLVLFFGLLIVAAMLGAPMPT